jgi:exopolysaccharide biosynthesis protein
VKEKLVQVVKDRKKLIIAIAALVVVSILSILLLLEKFYITNPQLVSSNQNLAKSQKEFNALKNQDQYKINKELIDKIQKSQNTYGKAISSYQALSDLRAQKQDTTSMDALLALALNDLEKLSYASADAKLIDLNSQIDKANAILAQKAAPAGQTTAPATVNNNPPGSGYSYQAVKIDSGTFNVAIIAADLNSTRVIIDTASDSTCTNNCPVLPLGTYAARSGAFAAINGSFFCPADYPSCAGKVNTFDTLLMNKNKVYFNSDNNKYSTVPLVYFSGSSMGVRGQTLDWGRDTGIDAVITNHPLYISGGNNNFGGSNEQKLNDVGTRTFVSNKGSMVYIGIIYNATSANAASVLKTMGMDNALGLDQGGSTALWMNGNYLAGPGRNIPNALLFVRK